MIHFICFCLVFAYHPPAPPEMAGLELFDLKQDTKSLNLD